MANFLISPNSILQALGEEYLRRSLQVASISICEKKSIAIADEFDCGKHNPTDPDTIKSYLAFTAETKQQFAFLVNKGYCFLPWPKEGQPYETSPPMFRDVREHKKLYVFMTQEGFGDEEDTLDQSKNPLLEASQVIPGWCNNDLFRAVHDVFGHALGGYSFAAPGELMAWRTHLEFYSHEARKAMTTETLGQNSWNNFNAGLRTPEGTLIEKNDPLWIPPKKRRFAQQKMMLMPNWVQEIYLGPKV